MKKLLLKTNLIPLALILLSLLFVSAVLTYAWYISSFDTDDTLHLQADGAQVIMFEAEVSDAAIQGKLFPATPTKQSLIDGTLPQKPQVIAKGGVLPDYIKRAAGIVKFDTNFTYYALGTTDRIKLEIVASVKIKGVDASRDLLSTGEVAVEYLFKLQDISITVGDDGVFNIRNVIFPEDSTVYRRNDKIFLSKISEYIPVTGDKILHNRKDDNTQYSLQGSSRVTKADQDVNIYEHQIAYIRGAKRYVEAYDKYVPQAGDNVVYLQKVNTEVIKGTNSKYVQNVALDEDVVFYRRNNKNYIEAVSTYVSGNSTDDNALKTGDQILYMSYNSGQVNSPASGVFIGQNAIHQQYQEYYLNSAYSSVRYVVNKAYYDANYASNSAYKKVFFISSQVNNITFNTNHVVYRRIYNNSSRLCVDEIVAYQPQTGDIIEYYNNYNASYVTLSNGEYSGNTVDLRDNTDPSNISSYDIIYENSNNKICWGKTSNFNFTTVHNSGKMHYANKLDTSVISTIVHTIVGEDNNTYSSKTHYKIKNVCIDGHIFARRTQTINYEYNNETITGQQLFLLVENNSYYTAQTNDVIYYQVYTDEEIVFDNNNNRYLANLLHLQLDETVYKRNGMVYVVKTIDYTEVAGDQLLFNQGSPIGEEMMLYDGYLFQINQVAARPNVEVVYLRNNRKFVVNKNSYNSQTGDIILLTSSGVITQAGLPHIKNAPAGSGLQYYVDGVSLLSDEVAFKRTNGYVYIYKNTSADLPTAPGTRIFDSGFMVVDPLTKFLLSSKVYLTTIDQETSRDLRGATIVASLSLESPDIT